MQRGRLPYLIIPIAALIPVLPLILYGCSCGHDFDFHLLNWLEAARQFAHGNLHPQWAFTPAFNAGEPRFVFYPPLSWNLGAILGLLMPWAWTPVLYTWIVLAAAGLSLLHLARSFAGPTAALLAAVLYLVNPYTLFTAYERTAYAELLAAVWIPLLLHGILRPDHEGGVTIPRIALPVALLWLTNAPAAVMGCYALALLTLFRLFLQNQNRLRLALTSIAGTALGLGLASIYLVPAAYERRYVQIAMAILPGMRIQDNFLFHHHTASALTSPAALPDALLHDQVLHTASIIALLLLALTAATLLWLSFTSRSDTFTPPPHTTLYGLTLRTLAIALLLTPISAPIWNHAPELAFLQFPWRLLAILAAVLALALAMALTRIHLSPAATAAIALATAAALTLPAYTLFHQPCDPEDTVAARVALFHSHLGPSSSGVEPTDEYTPITADNDALAHANPPYWLSPNPNASAPSNTTPGPAPQHLTLNSPIPQTLILNLRDYPAWHITLNHTPLNPQQRHSDPTDERPDGLITIPIPAGPAKINITYATLPDQIVGFILTLLSLIILSLIQLRTRKPPRILDSAPLIYH